MTPHEALETLKRLAEVKAKSTPGIWFVGLLGKTRGRPIATCGDWDVLSDYDGNCPPGGAFADSDFIASMHETDFAALAEAVEGEINPPVIESNDVGSTITAVLEDGSYRLTAKGGQVRRVTFFRSMKEMQLSDQLAAANAEISRLRKEYHELAAAVWAQPADEFSPLDHAKNVAEAEADTVRSGRCWNLEEEIARLRERVAELEKKQVPAVPFEMFTRCCDGCGGMLTDEERGLCDECKAESEGGDGE